MDPTELNTEHAGKKIWLVKVRDDCRIDMSFPRGRMELLRFAVTNTLGRPTSLLLAGASLPCTALARHLR